MRIRARYTKTIAQLPFASPMHSGKVDFVDSSRQRMLESYGRRCPYGP
jgi:hypothetical protein